MGILLAFLAAFGWGSSAFGGGLATRRRNHFHVLTLTAISGAFVMLAAMLVWHEEFPSWQGILWSVLGGLVGAIGVTAMYRGLSLGDSAIVAPTAAVIGTAFPVCYSMAQNGLLTLLQTAGFALALLGIWLVTRTSSSSTAVDNRKGFLLACLAGLCLGGFLVFISQVEPGKVFTPLLLTRSVTFGAALILLRANKLSFPSLNNSWIALTSGAVDAIADVLFLIAKQFARLDLVVIVGSLNSAIVVLLTAIFLKEKISRWQRAGVVLCVMAIIFISL